MFACGIFKKDFQKTLTYLLKYVIIYTERGGEKMEKQADIVKALQEIAKAIENNEAVAKVIVKIELQKPKSSKATESK